MGVLALEQAGRVLCSQSNLHLVKSIRVSEYQYTRVLEYQYTGASSFGLVFRSGTS